MKWQNRLLAGHVLEWICVDLYYGFHFITSLDILNRWGNLIYEYYDPAGTWDGKTQGGTLVEEGTYFYIIKAQFYGGEEITKQGFVQVVH